MPRWTRDELAAWLAKNRAQSGAASPAPSDVHIAEPALGATGQLACFNLNGPTECGGADTTGQMHPVAGNHIKARPVEVLVDLQASKDERNLNQLERDFLAYLRRIGVKWLGIQNVTVKLADDTRYTPDFSSLSQAKRGRVFYWEVKGPKFWDDAKVKLKVAAHDFPHFTFMLVTRDRQTKRWKIKRIEP